MRAHAIVTIIVLFGGMATIGPFPADGASTELPDLSVLPRYIHFNAFDRPISFISLEYPYLTIGAFIENLGPGPSSSTNVSFFIDGKLLALVPAGENIPGTEPDNWTVVEFIWDFSYTPAGNHTVRVQALDPIGDANPADNAAEVNITIHGRAPVLAVRFDTVVQHAEVSATVPDEVTFSGTVQADFDIGPFDILLNGSVNTGWPCSIDPPSLSVMDRLPHQFTVTVAVPPASPSSVTASVKVLANGTADGMTVSAKTMGIIWVQPYFCLTLAGNETTVTVPPGRMASFDLILKNSGNSIDTYSISVTNREDLERDGWIILLSRSSFERVPAGGNRTFFITMMPKEDATPYKQRTTTIDLKVSSLYSRDFNQDVNATLSLRVEQKGFNMPSLGVVCLIALVAALAGAVAVRRFRGRKRKPTIEDYDRELGLD